MYGDTTVIRRLADRMDERAEDIRSQVRSLRGNAEAATWVSVAGSAMKERVAERSADLNDVALAYEEAATKLREHAREVDELKALISRIQDKVTSMISAAVDRIKDAASAIAGGIKDLVTGDDDNGDEQMANYQAPPPGDRAWLDVPDELGINV